MRKKSLKKVSPLFLSSLVFFFYFSSSSIFIQIYLFFTKKINRLTKFKNVGSVNVASLHKNILEKGLLKQVRVPCKHVNASGLLVNLNALKAILKASFIRELFMGYIFCFLVIICRFELQIYNLYKFSSSFHEMKKLLTMQIEFF